MLPSGDNGVVIGSGVRLFEAAVRVPQGCNYCAQVLGYVEPIGDPVKVRRR